jgi:hypothetical protein
MTRSTRSGINWSVRASGPLPYSKFDIGGLWSDPTGGKIVGYRRYIAEDFPELACAADQETHIRRRPLVEKEESFARE